MPIADPKTVLHAAGFDTVRHDSPSRHVFLRIKTSGELEEVVSCFRNDKLGVWGLSLGLRLFDADCSATELYKNATDPWPATQGLACAKASVPWLRTERLVSFHVERSPKTLGGGTPQAAELLKLQPDPERFKIFSAEELGACVEAVFQHAFGGLETTDSLFAFFHAKAGEDFLQLSNAAALIALYLVLAHRLNQPMLPLPPHLERRAQGQLPPHLSPQSYIDRCMEILQRGS